MSGNHRYKALELEQSRICQLESLEVGVTSNCNFKCAYCCAYQRDDGAGLSGQEIIAVLEELPSLKRVRLSGGEVTLRYQDCLEVVAYCANRGIATQLNTNASLLSKKRMMELAKAGLSNIHISYNFTRAEDFAVYYGLPEAVHRTIERHIRYAVAAGLETVVETLLFDRTQDHLVEIHERVYELGVRIHEIQNGIIMRHSGWQAITARDALQQAISKLITARRADAVLYVTCMDRFAERLGIKEQEGVYISQCVDGTKQLHLHGNGDILICELCHPVVIGNIYKGTKLRDIYKHQPPQLADYLEKRPCPALEALFPGAR